MNNSPEESVDLHTNLSHFSYTSQTSEVKLPKPCFPYLESSHVSDLGLTRYSFTAPA